MCLKSIPKFLFPVLLFLGFSCQEQSMLSEISSSKSGLHFENSLQEDEFMNILTYEYFYNGAGVAIADFNADGWDNVFFMLVIQQTKRIGNKNTLCKLTVR
ncbi:hypothetical protein [Cyclobacterium sp.]|uniref:hypothetical protein n=1 Tax=Cyclobacterium sp. TaxID=1966343 RepID=UPI0019B4D13C|nr:hypothetical protein [Cyclobacterium sp.]MBD3630811.1 hypothetical protein [Cyclobacterium sp.]